MKLKSIITFSILFALSFSIVHEFAFATLDKEKCSVSEFVAELSAPTGSDDICDIHFEYHQSLIFPNAMIPLQKIQKTTELKLHNESYKFHTNLEIIIPPIA